MARYIDANKLQERLTQIESEPDYQHENENWCVGVCLAGTQVDLMPTADVVPVIRCKDCKYYDVYHLECHNLYHNGINNVDGYCNYAERIDKK